MGGDVFTSLSLGAGKIVNFDIAGVFSLSSCKLSLSFLDSFHFSVIVISTIVVSMLLGIFIGMYATRHPNPDSGLNGVDNFHRRQAQRSSGTTAMLTLLLLVYPSIANKTFIVFRCVQERGFSTWVLREDFRVKCWEGKHLSAVALAWSVIVCFILGLPIAILFLLWKTQHHFHDETSDRHHEVRSNFGVFLRQYEPQYWYYSVIELTFKMFLTGVLCVIAPRSPSQLIVALCICLCYTILILHQTPFVTKSSDRLAVVCAMSLTLTLAIGMLQMATFPKSSTEKLFKDTNDLDLALICVSIVPIIVFASNLILHGCHGKFRKSSSTTMTEVLPLDQTSKVLEGARKWDVSAPK